jgi:hypothetical protein
MRMTVKELKSGSHDQVQGFIPEFVWTYRGNLRMTLQYIKQGRNEYPSASEELFV